MPELTNKNPGKIIIESSLQLFLLRAVYVLLEVATRKPSLLVFAEPVYGIIVSLIIGFRIGKITGSKGWLFGAIPSIVYLFLSLIRALFFTEAGVSVSSSIVYAVIYVISGAIGGIVGGRKKV